MFENYIKFSVKITFDKNKKKKVTGHKKDWQKLKESRYNGEDNFAVLTGETNDLILLDLDTTENKSGLDWYIKSFGHELKESDTLVTGTINGGYHLYFKYDSRISSNSADKELLVDIRSNSGCGYQGKGYPIVLAKPPRSLTSSEIDKVIELQGKTPKKKQVVTELNEGSSTVMTVFDKKINKYLGIPEETTWEKSVTSNGYKAVPDCRECVVDPSKQHSTHQHSCIFVNTNPDSVVKSCFSCGVVTLDKKNSKKCMEYLKVIIETQENNVYQELTKELWEYACENGYKRKMDSGHVYTRVKSYAYIPYMSAKDFINMVFLDDTVFGSNVNNMDNLIKFMKNIDHTAFGFLKVNQEYLGFSNGVLNTRTLEFTQESLVPKDVVARKYFNQEFTGDTCTPLMDKILDYQFTPEVRDFIYTCLGRMFEIRDNYGFMYLQGEPGCGKSVVLDVISECFNNVGAISSTFEQKFGLGYLYDKDIVICDDIPEDIGKVLDQTTFQTITTNGMVSVAVKGGDGFSLKWTVPLLFAGNYSLKYKDKGQISRRVIVANFEKGVRKPDVSLKKRIIAEELPQFILKCLTMYNDLLEKGENKDIWGLCPEYFKDQQHELKMDRNPLFKFLSLYTIYMEGNVITMSDVREKYNEIMGVKCNIGNYIGTFAQVNEDYIVDRPKICKHCNKSGGKGCCEKYNYKDRSTKTIVINMGFVQRIMNDVELL
jgi:hypothetical protein